jgi:hypothetical protein
LLGIGLGGTAFSPFEHNTLGQRLKCHYYNHSSWQANCRQSFGFPSNNSSIPSPNPLPFSQVAHNEINPPTHPVFKLLPPPTTHSIPLPLPFPSHFPAISLIYLFVRPLDHRRRRRPNPLGQQRRNRSQHISSKSSFLPCCWQAQLACCQINCFCSRRRKRR